MHLNVRIYYYGVYGCDLKTWTLRVDLREKEAPHWLQWYFTCKCTSSTCRTTLSRFIGALLQSPHAQGMTDFAGPFTPCIDKCFERSDTLIYSPHGIPKPLSHKQMVWFEKLAAAVGSSCGADKKADMCSRGRRENKQWLTRRFC